MKSGMHAALTHDIQKKPERWLIGCRPACSKHHKGRWILKFKKRHGISQMILHGQGAAADQVYAEIGRVMSPKLLSGSSPHDIYNIEETGLKYRAILTRTVGSQDINGLILAKDPTCSHNFEEAAGELFAKGKNFVQDNRSDPVMQRLLA